MPTTAPGAVSEVAVLLREVRMAARLNHPTVCTIHEVGEAEGQVCVAVELVAGQRRVRGASRRGSKVGCSARSPLAGRVCGHSCPPR